MTEITQTAGPFTADAPRRRPRGRALLATARALWPIVGFLLLFCGMFFGLSWLVTPEPDVTASEPVAVAELDGRDVVVIAYSRDGPRGMFQLIFHPMFQSRLTAVDAATGERVWDENLDDALGSDMRVLAAADGVVYVATDEGLYIRSLADGSPMGLPGAIPDLGGGYVAEMGAYDVDPSRELVVALDQAGELWQIPFGDTVAVPADATTERLWRPILGDDFRFAMKFPSTEEAARIGTDTLAGQPIRSGARMQHLTLSSGGGTPLGDVDFLEPRFVLDGTAPTADGEPGYAAGRDAGYVLVQSATDATGDAYRLDSVDLATGEVIDTADVEVGYSIGGGYSHDGVTAIVIEPADAVFERDTVVVAASDGTLSVFTIGATNFFGMPV